MKKIYITVIGGATLIAAVIFGTTLVHAVWYAPDAEVTPPANVPHEQTAASSTYPVRVQIPHLSIDANVQQVGITAKGNVGTPSNFTDVAWYKYSPVPGHAGISLIDGHVDNGLGLDGVFKHLGDLSVGDDVYVTDRAGTKLHFVVDTIQTYPYDAVPSSALFDGGGSARLVLITCNGSWVSKDKTYNERLVVTAHLE